MFFVEINPECFDFSVLSLHSGLLYSLYLFLVPDHISFFMHLQNIIELYVKDFGDYLDVKKYVDTLKNSNVQCEKILKDKKLQYDNIEYIEYSKDIKKFLRNLSKMKIF